MAIVNQLNKPVTVAPPAPIQSEPVANQEMVIRTTAKENKLLSEKNILVSLILIALVIVGITGGLFLVQRRALFQSNTNSGWVIAETNINICEEEDCLLPGDLNYCSTSEGFELTTESCLGQGAIDINCSEGISGYIYHCPNQASGDCSENKKYIGTFKSGQTISAVAMASQFDCGMTRIEFSSTSESSIPGACGIVVLEDKKCTTK